MTKDQQSILDTIRQLKPINIYRVLVVAETLYKMEQEARKESVE